MKNKISIGILLVCFAVSIVFLAVFLPHFQSEIRYSGGVLEIEFEDGSKQYVADGGTIQVRQGSKCKVSVVAPIDSHTLYRHNDKEIAQGELITFDEMKNYYFDLYEKGGNCVSFYIVEVVA